MKQGISALLGIDVAGAGAAVGLTALVYFAGVSPALQAVQAATNQRLQLAEREAEVDRLETSLLTSTIKLQDAAKAERGSPRVGAGTALERIGRISVLAADSGVSVTDLSPKAEQPGTRFNRVPMTIAGVGTAPSFISLLNRMHVEFPDTQVVSLTITAIPENRELPAGLSAEFVWYTVADVAGQSAKTSGDSGAGRAGAGAKSDR